MHTHVCACVCMCMWGGISSRGGSILEGPGWAVGLEKEPGGFKELKEACGCRGEARKGVRSEVT